MKDKEYSIRDLLASPHALAGVVFLIALLPRLDWAFDRHPVLFSDMEDYYLAAVNFIRGKFLAMSEDRLAYRPPAYPLFLAVCLKLFPGYTLMAVRVVQSVVGALSGVLLFYIALRIFLPLQDNRPRFSPALLRGFAFASALTFSLLADQIFFCSVFLSETLFVFVLLIWILAGMYAIETQRLVFLVLFSFLLGIMALLRPIALLFIPILVFLTLTLTSKSGWKKWLWLPMTAWALPVLPWTIRNAVLLHAFVLISTNSGINFYIGNNPDYGYWSTGNKEAVRQELAQGGRINEVLEDRHFFRMGMDYVMEHPVLAVERGFKKLYYLYIYDEPPWPWLEYGYGTGPSFYQRTGIPHLWWNPLFLLLSLAGVTYAFLKKLSHWLPLSVIIMYSFACMVYFARTRFRLPLEPVLCVYTWLGLLSLAETVYSVFFYINRKKRGSGDVAAEFDRVDIRR